MGKLFSDREIRGVIYLLPLAGLFVVGALLVRPATDPAAAADIERRLEERTDSVVPAPFDPNTVDYETLRRLGLSKREAVSLLKYRAAGKVFRIPEDVALCYGFSDSLYRRLAPYMRRLRATGIFTKRQAEAFVRWRNLAGLRDMEEVRELRYVSDSAACIFARYALFPAREPDRTAERLDAGAEPGRFGRAARRLRHRREDRHGDPRLPRAAGRIPPGRATGRGSGRYGGQLRENFATNLLR